MLPQPAGRRRCFPRVDRILKHWCFFAAGISVFLVGKSMLIVMVPVLINKDVFVPCYTDLKFRVQNHNYYCTNLVLFFRLLYMSAKFKNIFYLYLSSTCTTLWFNICLHYKVITPHKSSYHSSSYSWSPSSKSPISQPLSFLVTSNLFFESVCFCFVYPSV